MSERKALVVAGIVIGIIAILLVLLGNPANMGFCIACFLRDIAGALGLHRAAMVQYLRPEIIGLLLGAFLTAWKFREFRSTGGSSVMLRFMLGVFMMMGALIFLGCPWRMLLRLAGGDLNALVALPGYLLGIWVGTLFLKQGYTLGQSQKQPRLSGLVGPLLALGLFLLLLAAPAFVFFSAEGPGSMRAPLFAALAAGLVVGVLAQRTRFCTMGAFRDIFLFRDFHLFSGVAALFLVVLAGNLLLGNFNAGFAGQPVAHTAHLWNFLGMGIVGLAAVLAGGCPLRQLILSGEGNADATATVLGLVAGAALMHNFGWAAAPAGVPGGGQAMVIVVLILLLAIGWFVTRQARQEEASSSVSPPA
ncbi:MAG TPA: YedE-related selenium metabolism membrane protein [Firmicutes bacterium]|nr:YedE-related selenium metabolism membrane protein [Bacillota bacterium]